jgi:hypothetical protein
MEIMSRRDSPSQNAWFGLLIVFPLDRGLSMAIEILGCARVDLLPGDDNWDRVIGRLASG